PRRLGDVDRAESRQHKGDGEGCRGAGEGAAAVQDHLGRRHHRTEVSLGREPTPAECPVPRNGMPLKKSVGERHPALGHVEQTGTYKLMAIACPAARLDNEGMNIPGRIQNGVVVLEGAIDLPEGTEVVVSLRSGPNIRVAEKQIPVQLPIFEYE